MRVTKSAECQSGKAKREAFLTAAPWNRQHMWKTPGLSDKVDRTQLKGINEPHILEPWETTSDTCEGLAIILAKKHLIYLAVI